MRKPHLRHTPLGDVTEYFDEPEKHGFEPVKKPLEADEPVKPVEPDETQGEGE